MNKKSQDNLSLAWFIANDKNVLQAKRQAKALLKQYQKKNACSNQYNLAMCQDEIAIKMGYQNWFDFYHQRKKENENHLYPQFIQNFKNQVITSFENIIAHCLSIEVDYLHFMIRPDNEKIAIRQYGQLNYYEPQIMLPMTLNEMLSRVFEHYFQQELEKEIFGIKEVTVLFKQKPVDVKLRFVRVPCYPGNSYDLVVKLYYQREELTNLESLGYSHEQVEQLIKIAQNSEPGMLLISGQIGSGMTTTLKTFLKEVDDENHIMEVDESEMIMRKVDLKANENKLILASLHSPNSEYAMARMEDLGLYPQDIENLTVINQRLMPVLCEHCKQPFSVASDKSHPDFSLYEKFKKHYSAKELAKTYIKGEGCPKCHYLGYEGKTVCSSLTPASQISQYEQSHGISPSKEMLDMAIKKMFEGKISAVDIDEKLCDGKVFNMS
jgi:type II secretory ATPase GspE/PulE/Tfp pilus assembly ATPase PilB-like protein